MSISRDNNAWISEWATQVAEHNSLPPIIGGSTGRTPPLSPTKIPSPIHARSQRMSRNRYVRINISYKNNKISIKHKKNCQYEQY